MNLLFPQSWGFGVLGMGRGVQSTNNQPGYTFQLKTHGSFMSDESIGKPIMNKQAMPPQPPITSEARRVSSILNYFAENAFFRLFFYNF